MTYRLRSHWWVDQELWSGGGGPAHTDKKIDFFSLFHRGVQFQGKQYCSVPEGGSTLFRVDPTFS